MNTAESTGTVPSRLWFPPAAPDFAGIRSSPRHVGPKNTRGDQPRASNWSRMKSGSRWSKSDLGTRATNPFPEPIRRCRPTPATSAVYPAGTSEPAGKKFAT